jgi:hypothetical protein
MTQTFFADRAALMSPRTTEYVQAMIRQGDGFDSNEWLKKVRQEEAQAKQAPTTIPAQVIAAQADNPINTSDSRDARPSLGPALISKPGHSRALRGPHRQAKSKTPKARLRRWLEKVRRAWGEFQARRRRDAVYDFLEEIFTVVEHYRVRRRTNRLVRHAFEFANLPFDKNADPLAS